MELEEKYEETEHLVTVECDYIVKIPKDMKFNSENEKAQYI